MIIEKERQALLFSNSNFSLFCALPLKMSNAWKKKSICTYVQRANEFPETDHISLSMEFPRKRFDYTLKQNPDKQRDIKQWISPAIQTKIFSFPLSNAKQWWVSQDRAHLPIYWETLAANLSLCVSCFTARFPRALWYEIHEKSTRFTTSWRLWTFTSKRTAAHLQRKKREFR